MCMSSSGISDFRLKRNVESLLNGGLEGCTGGCDRGEQFNLNVRNLLRLALMV